jgi:hypothetical protein
MSVKIELGFIFFISPKIILKQNLKILRLKNSSVVAIKYMMETFLPVFYTLQKDFCSFDSTCINIFILVKQILIPSFTKYRNSPMAAGSGF